ncbi:MAG: efflux RND transporter periplasmic adaptor subunit [Gammaproteobacteria bacterium]|uniref:efflux RND transporter periplasmic adaptor subunit n=1 Tax=Rhodoferax sp. TaxID=50421 RepID=UPI0017CEC9ED|nr:efflux RND transporter periplasmic adaptor subunit [Rhodoferax sp.]MBU3897852.1 efflux RND transporter periplasmic adaptor subunit [Gammaproteobacteria bacterium]MBA3059245.1 efflux RND transporter periplasmic adaptor subunit [Rhodoferax sp.]MBU3997321.1 efflux RND transporter periplasmic adaptor subunit [Gammaproteobacteria bacterium]MBU4017927.1 efflux RND transporter periplasmic adaptor subunit [Gammaproteobacteria bacterium]MBU4078618.1 efflux RND transporter periplasmic adaptor subunit
MTNKLIYPLIAVVGIAGASGAAWWYQSQPKSAQQVTQAPSVRGASGKAASAGAIPRVAGVEVAQVERVSLQDDAQSVGTLRSRQSVMLRPEVAGRVKALGFRDGARVRKGQLLVQLDDTLQRAEVRQAQAQVSIAQATLKRNQELVAENFVAQRVLDESAANVQVVQAQLALANARLSRMAIVAPFNGTVGIRNVSLGDYVKDGADLVNLEDISSLYVDFRLPERYQGKLKPQQAVALTLDALPGRTFEARVEAIDPLLDANGRSVGVRAVLPNTLSDKRPGMFARVTVLFSVNANALVVPEEAIVPQGERQFVIKVVAPSNLPPATAKPPPDTQWVSQRQEVRLGVRRAGQVEITEGLAEGQRVVVAGQQRLQRDGTPVRIVTLDRPAPAASAPVPAASL